MPKCGDCENWQPLAMAQFRLGICNKKIKKPGSATNPPKYERTAIDLDASNCELFVKAEYLQTDSSQSSMDLHARPTTDYELRKQDVSVDSASWTRASGDTGDAKGWG